MFDESEYELFSVSTAVFVAGSLVPVAALLAALVFVPGGWLSLATILAVVAVPVTVGLVRTAVEEDDVAQFVGGDAERAHWEHAVLVPGPIDGGGRHNDRK